MSRDYEDLTPVTRSDLEHALATFKNEVEADWAKRYFRWLGAISGSVMFGMLGVAWASSAWRKDVESRVAATEVQMHYIDVNGTAAGRGLVRTVDSLRVEMRLLPGAVVDELEIRGWRRGAR